MYLRAIRVAGSPKGRGRSRASSRPGARPTGSMSCSVRSRPASCRSSPTRRGSAPSSRRSIAGSSWDTAADREASHAALAPIREELMATAGSSPQVENYDVVFADVRVAAGARS